MWGIKPGDTLGRRYRLVSQIGRGATSTVYQAVDEVLERSVAIKLYDGAHSQLNNVARQIVEMRALAAVAHPNLVTVYDGHVASDPAAGSDVDPTYIVLELVEGITLSEALVAGPMPPETVGKIGLALAQALSAVHAAYVVHRDVKPGNVLLTSAGTVKLGDFGLARLLGDDAALITTGAEVMGTAAYLSPEQVCSSAVRYPSDIYSLGLVLLECLTGRRSYAGDAAQAALARLVRRPDIPDSLPAPWPALLSAMTASDPRMRPSADELSRTMSAFIETPDAPGTDGGSDATDGWSSPLGPFLIEATPPARSAAASVRRFSLAAAAIAAVTAAAVFFAGGYNNTHPVPGASDGAAEPASAAEVVESPSAPEAASVDLSSSAGPANKLAPVPETTASAAEPTPTSSQAEAPGAEAPAGPGVGAVEVDANVSPTESELTDIEPAPTSVDNPPPAPPEDPEPGQQPDEKSKNGNGNGGNNGGGGGNKGGGNGGNGGKGKDKG